MFGGGEDAGRHRLPRIDYLQAAGLMLTHAATLQPLTRMRDPCFFVLNCIILVLY